MTDNPIRLFIGCAANGEDAESQAVLEWSVRKRASLPVEITWMKLSRDPASPFHCNPEAGEGWATEQWATPFSGLRWAVPVLCGFKGRAIYMDSDVIVMADIAELWRQPFERGKVVMTRGGNRFCVSLWDCEAAASFLPRLGDIARRADAHRRLCGFFASHAELVQRFASAWNCLDGEDFADLENGTVKAIHYTDMSTQPQLRHALPRLAAEGRRHWYDGPLRQHRRPDLVALFDRLLEEARGNGFAPARYLGDPPFGAYRKASLTHYRGGISASRQAGAPPA